MRISGGRHNGAKSVATDQELVTRGDISLDYFSQQVFLTKTNGFFKPLLSKLKS
jgi:hypothetical protein